LDISINSYLTTTTAEGPGTRFCIWVQGCSIRCKGCANSHMWDRNKGRFFDVEEIISLIEKWKDKIEGVTFLGGEPIDQIGAVTYIAKRVQEIGLTVVVFTGYEFEKIKKQTEELQKYTDILIDGKFVEEKTDYSRPWVGSSNQNYYFLSDKYDESIFQKYRNKFEIRIDKNNQIFLNGMGDFKNLMKAI